MRPIEQQAEELGYEISLDPIQPGDTYLAGRNSEPKLLTCSKIVDGFIVPTEFAYCFDVRECVKIVGTV